MHRPPRTNVPTRPGLLLIFLFYFLFFIGIKIRPRWCPHVLYLFLSSFIGTKISPTTVPTRPGLLLIFLFLFFIFYWYKNFTYHRAHTSWIFLFHFVYFSCQRLLKTPNYKCLRERCWKREMLGEKKETWWGSTKREMLCCFALRTFSKVSTLVHLLPW